MELEALVDRVDMTRSEVRELIGMAKGEPFSALHKWISQSTERESQARSNEKEYVARWKNHANSLNEQIELLKRNQARPQATLSLVFTQNSSDPQAWLRFVKTVDWHVMVPVGSSVTLRLYGNVFIYPTVGHYSVEGLDSINSLPELLVMMEPYKRRLEQKEIECLPLYGYVEQATRNASDAGARDHAKHT